MICFVPCHRWHNKTRRTYAPLEKGFFDKEKGKQFCSWMNPTLPKYVSSRKEIVNYEKSYLQVAPGGLSRWADHEKMTRVTYKKNFVLFLLFIITRRKQRKHQTYAHTYLFLNSFLEYKLWLYIIILPRIERKAHA